MEHAHSAIAIREISEVILKRKKSFKNICLNINISVNYKGIKIIPLGSSDYIGKVETIVDKKGNFFYKLSGKHVSAYSNKETDIHTVSRGYISVTPLQINQTDYKLMKK
jgi:5'-nucleotidase